MVDSRYYRSGKHCSPSQVLGILLTTHSIFGSSPLLVSTQEHQVGLAPGLGVCACNQLHLGLYLASLNIPTDTLPLGRVSKDSNAAKHETYFLAVFLPGALALFKPCKSVAGMQTSSEG